MGYFLSVHEILRDKVKFGTSLINAVLPDELELLKCQSLNINVHPIAMYTGAFPCTARFVLLALVTRESLSFALER